jgi:hypothetical protein
MEDNEDFLFDEEVAASFIEFLIDNGCMEVVGVNDDGEFLFSMTSKMEEMFPEIWEEVMSMTNFAVNGLWQKGLVELVFQSSGEILVSPNDNTLKYKQYDLTEEETLTIETIISRMND